jgi:hypothetical protein
VAGYTGTYDANPHGATGSATGVDAGGAAAGSTLNLGASFTNVPGGTAHWVFSGGTNYNDQSGDVAIVINKADAVVSVTGYTGVYDGAFHGASGTASGVDAGGAALGGSLNLGASFRNVPGGTAHWVFSGGTNYNDQGGNVAIVVTVKSIVGSINAADKPYDGTTATSITSRTLAGVIPGDNVIYVGGTATFANANVGTWVVTATGLSLSGTDAVNYVVNTTATTTAKITPKLLAVDSATTQSALNIAKDGNISFRIDPNENGIVDGKTVAQLFNGAYFRLKVGANTYSVQAVASVANGIIQFDFRMTTELKSLLASLTTATNASNAPSIGLELLALSNDGNYTLDATAWTRLFNSTK